MPLTAADSCFIFLLNMWGFFKRRQEGDLRRLASAYRYYLKSAQQAEQDGLLDESQKKVRRWKGGFGKAFKQLFMEWPSPQQSRRFEKQMLRWLAKTDHLDYAFICAFNDFLGQKKLKPEELKEVMNEGKDAF